MFVIRLVFLSLGCAATVADIVQRPTDVVTKEGGRVVFTCSTDASTLLVSWTFLPADGRTTIPITLYFDGEIELDGYSVIKSRLGHHDLLIESVQAKQAGRYDCTDENGFSATAFASAQLVVVRPDLIPQCDVTELSSSSSCPGCKTLEINCQLGYVGFVKDYPRVSWTDAEGGILEGGKNNVTKSYTGGGVLLNSFASNIRVNFDRLSRLISSNVQYTVHLTYDYGDVLNQHNYSAGLTNNIAIRELRRGQADVYGGLKSFRPVGLTIAISFVSGFSLFALVAVVIVCCSMARFKHRRIRNIDYAVNSHKSLGWTATSHRNTSTSTSNRPLSTVSDDDHIYDEVKDTVGSYQPLYDVAWPSAKLLQTLTLSTSQPLNEEKCGFTYANESIENT